VGDGALLALAVAATALYLPLPTAWLRSGTVHVAPDGFDGFPGSTRQLAVRTIQRAVDLAAPGETVLIWPGTYPESVHVRRGGGPGRPLVLRAAVPGKAVISGATSSPVARSWRWRSIGPRRWVTATGWRVDGLRVDGVPAYRATTRVKLEEACRRPGAWPAFFATDRRLDLCLPAGGAPRAERFAVQRPGPKRTNSGGHQVASLWLEAPWLEVHDLVFDHPVFAAIQLWDTAHVRIQGNVFRGADVAVNDRPGLRTAAAITISHNLADAWPLGQWRRSGWLSWWEAYPYSNSSLVWLAGADLRVAHNLIGEAGDGIKIVPRAGRNFAEANVIGMVVDDAFEIDDRAVRLTLARNLVADSYVMLSFSPMPGGSVRVSDNVFLGRPDRFDTSSSVLLKLLVDPVDGVELDHNLFVGGGLGWNPPTVRLRNVRLVDNTLASVGGARELAARDRILGPGNRMVTLLPGGWPPAAAGPVALAPLLGPVRPLAMPRPGPAWLRPGMDPAFDRLQPLLRSGWIVPPPKLP
jgi:hypothetical protein